MLEKDDKIGEYLLVKFLGKGQFGEVWLAEKKLQFSTRKVRHALKFLSNLGEEVNLKAAEAEVDTWIEAGGHPNVMSVIDMLVAGNHIVIVSEFAEGGSLNNWLKTHGGKAPSEEKALEMMLGILRGIEHLHSRNVVHRDLKPDNILLQGNFPRITDFGISRIVDEGTMSTKAIGSPAYMSPESFAGNKSPQTDIWSAGVILYEMLTAKFPYEHETVWGLVNLIQSEEPKPLPEYVSPESRKIVENALQKDVGKRFQTAHEMLLAVERGIYNLKGNTDQKHIATEILVALEPPTKRQIPLGTDEQSKINTEILNSPPKEETKSEANQETFYPLAATEKVIGQTQASPTIKTNIREFEKTVDLHEAERQKNEAQLTDFAKLDSNFGINQANRAQSKKKPIGIIAGIAGGIIGISLIGFSLWSMSGKSPTIANSNSTKNEIPANTKNVAPVPNAPQGMVYVPGGEFTMGRDDGKSEAEKPAHKVSVLPFFMDVYEVTVQKYDNPKSDAKGLPKVGVNWQQAADFCKKNGKRLPTEEEWEFAARGTNNFIYPWGNDWKDGNANVGTQSFAEVGKFKGESPFGIYDMVGNAWEWTSNDFKAYPGGKLPDDLKPNLKTIRGGSFEATKEFATTTYRIGWAATGAATYGRTGFRCVADVK